ncbi:ThiF family adenylyltransferase [Actinocorallia lasiicapitis]
MFAADSPSAWEELDTLLRSGAVAVAHDTIEAQVEELIRCRCPFVDAKSAAEIKHRLIGEAPQRYGTWVWYPWSGSIIHTLPEPEFRELRGNRNLPLISPAQRAVLAARRIGVVGLTSGAETARGLCLEGIGAHLRLSDGGTVELSHLNRIGARLADVGAPKADWLARRLTETDPYLDVEVRPAVTAETVGRFCDGLDLIVEQCDDLPTRFLVREHARTRGIPVVSAVDECDLLDIERFDLDRTQPVFHGLAGALTSAQVRALSPDRLRSLHLHLTAHENLRGGVKAALPRLGKELASWPRRASDTAAAAVSSVRAIRLILLATDDLPSGRYFVDAEIDRTKGAP